MIEFKKDCYALWVDTDEVHSHILGLFTNHSDADVLKKGKGWYGGDGWVKPHTVEVRIFESREEFDNVKISDEKEAALAKLTDREKELLGYISTD